MANLNPEHYYIVSARRRDGSNQKRSSKSYPLPIAKKLVEDRNNSGDDLVHWLEIDQPGEPWPGKPAHVGGEPSLPRLYAVIDQHEIARRLKKLQTLSREFNDQLETQTGSSYAVLGLKGVKVLEEYTEFLTELAAQVTQAGQAETDRRLREANLSADEIHELLTAAITRGEGGSGEGGQ